MQKFSCCCSFECDKFSWFENGVKYSHLFMFVCLHVINGCYFDEILVSFITLDKIHQNRHTFVRGQIVEQLYLVRLFSFIRPQFLDHYSKTLRYNDDYGSKCNFQRQRIYFD